jgi:hypothetical protein
MVMCNVITYYQIDSVKDNLHTSNSSLLHYYDTISCEYSDLYKLANNLCANEKYCLLIDNRIKKIAIGRPKIDDVDCATDKLKLYLQIDNNQNLCLRERTEQIINSEILDKINETCYFNKNKAPSNFVKLIGGILAVLYVVIISFLYHRSSANNLDQLVDSINDYDIYYLSSSDDDLDSDSDSDSDSGSDYDSDANAVADTN